MKKEQLERYIGSGVRLVDTRSGYGVEGHVKAVRDGGINIGGAWYGAGSTCIIIPVDPETLKQKL